MKLIPCSGFQVVEPDAAGELRYIPIVAFQTSDDEAHWVEPITQPIVGDYAPPYPDKLIMRSDGWLVDQQGRVGTTQAAIQRFANYRPRQHRVQRQRWLHRSLTAPLEADARGRAFYAD